MALDNDQRRIPDAASAAFDAQVEVTKDKATATMALFIADWCGIERI